MSDYLVYDVFTREPFGGNPLAIVPDATGFQESQLQSIAREFNFSETTFVFPPINRGSTARVRIFTPTMEIPFAGHPTIGTAIALSDLGRGGPEMVLDLGVGPIPVSVNGTQAEFTTHVPLKTWPGPTVSEVADSISLADANIRTDRHLPAIASVGLPFAIAELENRAALSKCEVNSQAFKDITKDWPTQSHYDLLVYVRNAETIHARMFAPLDGIPEDPATGSAAAALVAFLGQLEGTDLNLRIHQGLEMGRPSEIGARVTVADGVPTSVNIAGSAVRVMKGQLTF